MSAQPKATLEQLLQHMGFPATITEQHFEDGLLLEVQTEDSGRLIGRQGQTLSQHMGFPATITEQHFEDGLLLEVQTEDSGRLIGRQGQTLSDLQYVLNRLVFQQDSTAPKVTVDVGGYRAQAREALVQKAKAAAEKVRRWGDVVELEPMSAFDRRIVHSALKDDPAIETHSVEVEGTDRKVILLRPKH